MLCRCTRWHASRAIPDKQEDTLMKAIDELWVAVHGPMKELITDSEGGIVLSDKTTQYLPGKASSSVPEVRTSMPDMSKGVEPCCGTPYIASRDNCKKKDLPEFRSRASSPRPPSVAMLY